MMRRLIDLLKKHEDIPEAASAMDAIGDGEFEYALKMLDQVLVHSRITEDAILVAQAVRNRDREGVVPPVEIRVVKLTDGLEVSAPGQSKTTVVTMLREALELLDAADG
jgi:hypothetical protein